MLAVPDALAKNAHTFLLGSTRLGSVTSVTSCEHHHACARCLSLWTLGKYTLCICAYACPKKISI